MISIGTAGWSIPRPLATAFPGEGTQLERYARSCNCAEINSSFYRPHRIELYQRWASLTPHGFRFAVKLPRIITHEDRLRAARLPLRRFLAEVAGLGAKLGPLLIQLPPSFAYDARVAARFFGVLRELHDGAAVCEPRHASWFAPRAEALLRRHRIGRVAADPALAPAAAQPGGWLGAAADDADATVLYYRLHGAPRVYWSRYPPARIRHWAAALAALPPRADAWCIFDNTASGAALQNALELQALLTPQRSVRNGRAAAPHAAITST